MEYFDKLKALFLKAYDDDKREFSSIKIVHSLAEIGNSVVYFSSLEVLERDEDYILPTKFLQSEHVRHVQESMNYINHICDVNNVPPVFNVDFEKDDEVIKAACEVMAEISGNEVKHREKIKEIHAVLNDYEEGIGKIETASFKEKLRNIRADVKNTNRSLEREEPEI